ncbi:hypothetical protein GCM10009037_15710 [Halarchaeum grantii]|uniref:Uncharacterized protein n=1 Tax=Halarchaeum grantii TaxID=1193105 RepID=A0A830F9J1_9EURY|nr:hypothetical protein GCM10009037_15710 [Halarchaeum grantii]
MNDTHEACRGRFRASITGYNCGTTFKPCYVTMTRRNRDTVSGRASAAAAGSRIDHRLPVRGAGDDEWPSTHDPGPTDARLHT